MTIVMDATGINSEEFRDVIGRFATGVTVVTAADGDRRFGSTASAVSSLSLEPPMLLVCLNRSSATGAAVARTGSFAVNILAEDQDHLARRFASREPDKFRGVAVATGHGPHPLLDGALAHLECRVTKRVDGGTHTVFLGEIDHALGREGAPLAYFRGQFGRLRLSQDEQAHLSLRAAVIARSIEVGRPLHLAALADRLGVPQRSVHQALVRLVDEGLAEEQDGAFIVVPLTAAIVEDTFRARMTMQLGAAAASVGRLSAEQLAELRALAEGRAATACDEPTAAEGFEVDQAFHEHLLRAAGSDALVGAYRRLTVPGLMTRSLGSDPGLTATVAGDRTAIVDAYEAGDLAGAAQAISHACERAIVFQRDRLRRAGGYI